MNNAKDERAITLTKDKAREKEERAAVRQLIRTMNYKQLHHVRFYIYGLSWTEEQIKNYQNCANKSKKND